MEQTELNSKAKQLCDLGLCCSMGEARRLVVTGRAERVIARHMKTEEKQENLLKD